jgi:hypothetical protein
VFLIYNTIFRKLSLKDKISKLKIIWNMITMNIFNSRTKIKWKGFCLLCEICELLNPPFVSYRKWSFKLFNTCTVEGWRKWNNIFHTFIFTDYTFCVPTLGYDIRSNTYHWPSLRILLLTSVRIRFVVPTQETYHKCGPSVRRSLKQKII